MHRTVATAGFRRTIVRGFALACTLAFLPEVVLLTGYYAVDGYLTLDISAIVPVLLPCASLALLASILEARHLWSRRSYQDAILVVGLTGIAFLLALDAAFSAWSGNATCYECGFGWFFMLVLPSLVLEFVAGVTWLLLLLEARRQSKTPALGAS